MNNASPLIDTLNPEIPLSSSSDKSIPASSYVKIGGILINTQYSDGMYHCVLGIGLNLYNSAPTTSLMAVLGKIQNSTSWPSTPLKWERMLACLVAAISSLYNRFCVTGFDRTFQEQYYKYWLHSNQLVKIEGEHGKVRIRGITRDWGNLIAEEIIGSDDGTTEEMTGKTIELFSDGNSFDFFQGLIKKKH